MGQVLSSRENMATMSWVDHQVLSLGGGIDGERKVHAVRVDEGGICVLYYLD